MRLAVSVSVGAALLVCGCQAFSNHQLANRTAEESAGVYREDAPAQRRRPRTLDYLTEMSAAPSAADHPRHTPRSEPQSGELGIDEVGLGESEVHVDTRMSIGDAVDENESQLPAILESDTHEFRADTPSYTLSDQPGSPAVPGATPPETAVPPASRIATTTGPPVTRQTSAQEDTSPDGLRLVVESQAEPATRIPSSVDELFVSKSSSAPAAGDTIAQIHPPVQPASFEQQEQPSATPSSPPASNAAVAAPEPVPSAASPQRTWEQQLSTAIGQLEQQMRETESGAGTQQQVRLQLLRLVAGQPLQQIADITGQPSEKLYWQKQLEVIQMLLNDSKLDSPAVSTTAAWRRSATQASRQLKLALDELANVASLQLDHVAYCSEVRGFGQYKPIPARFHAGQQVLIYCEVNNYSLQATDGAGQGAQQAARLQGRYAIVDGENRVVYQYEYQPVEDLAQRRRKDFYMFFPVVMPELPLGNYRLQLSVEDLVGNKVASAGHDLSFQIQAAPAHPSNRPPQTAAAPPAGHPR